MSVSSQENKGVDRENSLNTRVGFCLRCVQTLKVDCRIHVVLYALIIIPAVVLVMSSSSIFADAVPGGGGGGSVYTETWTVSTTTTNSSATNTSKQKVVVTVDGEDVLISVVIGGTSILIGRMSNSRKKPEKETRPDSIMLASDLDAFTPEMKAELLKNLKNEIDQQRKNLNAEMIKKRLEEFERLKNNQYFDDAIQRLKNMREEPTFDNIQEQVETLKKKFEELRDLKQCPKCDKPVQATPVETKFGGDLVRYGHHDQSVGGTHNWWASRENDKSAWDHWRQERNLPTMYTHCKCAYCRTMHRRSDIKPSNGVIDRWFGHGPQFKCQNPKCGKEQWVPKTNEWKDETVDIFR